MATLPRNLIIAIVLVIPLFSKLSLTSFVSIDCGTSQSNTTDPQTNITWTWDADYIQHGNTHNVSLGSGIFSTLRAFTTWKKYCYSIGVEKGEKVLARASFFYGNYDNKSSPPNFDLMFDGNYWASVNTSILDHVDYEAIYVTKGNYTDICVAQSKPSQVPFISSIELRSLNSSMYNHVGPNHALILLSRRAFGANQDLRYPDDTFDRIWKSNENGNETLYSIKNEASDINTTTAEDKPPKAAMQNALTVPNKTYKIQFNLSSLVPPAPINNNNNNNSISSDDDNSNWLYINGYFSEVMKDAEGKRSIEIYSSGNSSNGRMLLLGSVVPPFGSVQEVHINIRVSWESNSSLYFQAKPASEFPVIVNAMELYRVQPLAEGTDSRDVEGLRKLQLAFNKTLIEWSGDPCLPIPHAWDWIKCSTTDSKPRVKALNLSGYNLHGALPDFRSMDALEIIDLHNNTIEGTIPGFLGFLPLLRVLNLSYNRFNGPIPTSLNNTDINIDLRNNHLVQMHFEQHNTTGIVNGAPKNMMSLKLLRVLIIVAATQILQYLCYG